MTACTLPPIFRTAFRPFAIGLVGNPVVNYNAKVFAHNVFPIVRDRLYHKHQPDRVVIQIRDRAIFYIEIIGLL